MADKSDTATAGNQFGCFIAIVLGIAFLIWVTGSKDHSETAVNNVASQEPNFALEAAGDASPAPPLAFDARAAKRGAGQFQIIASAHVPESSEIFSRNCYEALGKPYNWHQLDRCGGYDALAVRWTELNEENAGEDDLSYFQSESAATRYAKAASAGGLPIADANERWASVQRVASAFRVSRPVVVPAVAAPMVDENGNPIAAADDALNAAAAAVDNISDE